MFHLDITDYTTLSNQTVFIPMNSTLVCVQIMITNDGITEGAEQFGVTIAASNDNDNVGVVSSANVTITDDDGMKLVMPSDSVASKFSKTYFLYGSAPTYESRIPPLVQLYFQLGNCTIHQESCYIYLPLNHYYI